MAFVPIVYRHQECRKLSTPLMDDGESTGKSREGGGMQRPPGGKGNRGRNSMNCDLLYVPNERNNYARVNEARAPLYNSTLIYGFGTSSEKHLGKHCTNVGFLDSASSNVQTLCILIFLFLSHIAIFILT